MEGKELVIMTRKSNSIPDSLLSRMIPSQKGESYNRFVLFLQNLNASLIDDEWYGTNHAYKVICVNGHLCSIWPNDAFRRGRICRKCYDENRPISGKSIAAQIAFEQWIIDNGGTLIDREWKGANAPHKVICMEGHICYPRMRYGIDKINRGICRVCAKRDPETAFNNFKENLVSIGAVLLDSEWKGANVAHTVKCMNGHITTASHANLSQGWGICAECQYDWDVVYVVTGITLVKFGISSKGGKSRLNAHKYKGFANIARLYTNLPFDKAINTERIIRKELYDRNIYPLHGREYYDITYLDTIVEIIDRELNSNESE